MHRALPPKLPSAYDFSISSIMPETLKNFYKSASASIPDSSTQPKYTLKDLIGDPGTKKVENALAERLFSELNDCLPCSFALSADENYILTNSDIPSLGISARKRPDVVIYDRRETGKQFAFVQIEVESRKNQASTIKKLEIGLIEQLRHQRNINNTIFSCTGFYFPNKVPRQVLKVTVTWDEKNFMFKSEVSFIHQPCSPIDKVPSDVLSEVIHVFNEEDQKKLGPSPGNFFAIPLSQTCIDRLFNRGARQVGAGQSIVVMNERESQVYKIPLCESSAANLLECQIKYMECQSQRICLPVRKILTPKRTFVYPLHIPPKTVSEARNDIHNLVSSVVKALQELHDVYELAHLDIRLPNICYKKGEDGSMEAVLIDLDRSDHVDKLAELDNNTYGDSVMYKPPPEAKDWKLKNLDWRQLGLMMCFILDARPVEKRNFHHELPDVDELPPFITNLVYKGDYSRRLHEKWKREPVKLVASWHST